MHAGLRFQALDSFRGLFAIAVVFYHLRVSESITEWAFFRNAEVFVAFFFVLSGFVLTHAYAARAAFQFRTFFIARTFRLLPLHLFMLGVFILLECGRYVAYEQGMAFNNVPFTERFAPSQILPNAVLLQSWTHLSNPLSFNYPSWSISIEYYTYMLFALILVGAARLRQWIWATLAVVALALIYSGNTFFTIEALRGLAYFFTGCLAYAVHRYLTHAWQPGYWVLTALEAISVLAVLLFVVNDFDAKAMVASPLFGSVILVFAHDGGALSRLLCGRGFSLLGKLSYSIYLTHAAILFCVVSAFMVAAKVLDMDITPVLDGTRFLDTGDVLGNNLVALSVVASVVLVSMFTYRYVELTGQAAGRALIGTRPNEPALNQR